MVNAVRKAPQPFIATNEEGQTIYRPWGAFGTGYGLASAAQGATLSGRHQVVFQLCFLATVIKLVVTQELSIRAGHPQHGSVDLAYALLACILLSNLLALYQVRGLPILERRRSPWMALQRASVGLGRPGILIAQLALVGLTAMFWPESFGAIAHKISSLERFQWTILEAASALGAFYCGLLMLAKAD